MSYVFHIIYRFGNFEILNFKSCRSFGTVYRGRIFQIVILKDLYRRQVICKQWDGEREFLHRQQNIPSRKNDNSRLRKDGISGCLDYHKILIKYCTNFYSDNA